MRIQIEKQDLIEGVQVVENIINPKTTLPILSNILLETSQDKLKIIATDLDIGIATSVSVEVNEVGAITIPAKRFGEIIRESPEGKISINAKKNNMVAIECQNCQFKLMGLPREEFPKLPEFKDKDVIKLDASGLKEMLGLTMFAISHDETRYVLNGALFELKDGILKIVATDGRRLALSERKLETSTKKEISVIVPSKAIHELNRNLKTDGVVSMVLGENQILFDLGASQIICRMIEGEFPDYQQVIPGPAATKIKTDRIQFLLALRRAHILSTQDYQAVKLEVFKDKLVVSKSTPDVGESREEVPVEYAGKEVVVGFNPVYLLDVLKNLNDADVSLEISGADKPAVIRKEDYIYIVLPMRI